MNEENGINDQQAAETRQTNPAALVSEEVSAVAPESQDSMAAGSPCGLPCA